MNRTNTKAYSYYCEDNGVRQLVIKASRLIAVLMEEETLHGIIEEPDPMCGYHF